MLLATALAYLLQDMLNRRLLFKTNQQQVAPKPSPIISSFLELGRRKLCRCNKIVAAQKMLLKSKKPANIRKWIARFFVLWAFMLRWSAMCAHNNCMGAHRYGALSALLINMLLGSFQLFLHIVISLSLRVK